jgi:hypothetical protein
LNPLTGTFISSPSRRGDSPITITTHPPAEPLAKPVFPGHCPGNIPEQLEMGIVMTVVILNPDGDEESLKITS